MAERTSRSLRGRYDRWEALDAGRLHGEILARSGKERGAREQLEAAEETARELEYAPAIALSVCRLAALPGGDLRAAARTIEALAERLPIADRIQAHHMLWKAGGDKAQLTAARAALEQLLAKQSTEEADRLVKNVEMYAEIQRAR